MRKPSITKIGEKFIINTKFEKIYHQLLIFSKHATIEEALLDIKDHCILTEYHGEHSREKKIQFLIEGIIGIRILIKNIDKY